MKKQGRNWGYMNFQKLIIIKMDKETNVERVDLTWLYAWILGMCMASMIWLIAITVLRGGC